MTIYPNAGRDFIQDGQSYWGPSAVIWRPPRDIERRDLHLADWNGDGKCGKSSLLAIFRSVKVN
jgi:hypothetical protein